MSGCTAEQREIALVDLLDRALNKGVVLWGDITLSVADVDLVYLGLKILVSSVEKAQEMRSRAARLSLLERGDE